MKNLLIFDAYGTLISTGNGSINAVKKILALQDKAIDPVQFYSDWKKLHRLHLDKSNSGKFITERQIFKNDLEQLYRIYNIERSFSDDVQIMLDSLYDRELFPDTLSAINQLRKNYRVVIGSTTDTQPLLYNIQANSLVVDAIYTSEAIGCYKPDIRFYKYILRAEHVDANAAIFIGDSLVDDVKGPKEISIETVLIDRKSAYTFTSNASSPDHIISDLCEIADILS